MIKRMICIAVCAWMCACCEKNDGGVLEPVEPPIEKPEKPTTPPSTEDLRTIKIEENIMAVVGTNNWNAIAYGNGKYVAVDASGYATTSTDGKTWTTPTKIAEFSYTWNDIIYANGKFVVCGIYSYIAVSTNGTNWTTYKVDSSAKYYWNGIAYGNGKFVVVGGSGRMSSSSNGTSWTTPEYHYSYGSWLSIAYGNGKFVVAGNSSSDYIGVSTDGINWSWYNKPPGLMAYGMAYGNGKFVASSINGRLYTSDDTGQTWSYIVPDIDGLSPTNHDRYLNIVYNGEMFIAVGYNYSWNDDESKNLYTDIVTTSTDGVNWSTAVPIKDELGNVLRLTTLSIIAVSA